MQVYYTTLIYKKTIGVTMQEKRDSFIFYRSFFESMDGLADDVQLVLYKSIVALSLLDRNRKKSFHTYKTTNIS